MNNLKYQYETRSRTLTVLFEGLVAQTPSGAAQAMDLYRTHGDNTLAFVKKNSKMLAVEANRLAAADGTGLAREVAALNPVEIVLDVNSGGGSVSFFEAFGKGLLELCGPGKSCKKITSRLRKGSSCASACVGLYNIGHEREADPDAKFGFHSGSTTKVGRAFFNIAGPLRVKVSGKPGVEHYYREMGVSQEFLDSCRRDKNKSCFSSTDITWFSAREVFSYGIVTKILRDTEPRAKPRFAAGNEPR